MIWTDILHVSTKLVLKAHYIITQDQVGLSPSYTTVTSRI